MVKVLEPPPGVNLVFAVPTSDIENFDSTNVKYDYHYIILNFNYSVFVIDF